MTLGNLISQIHGAEATTPNDMNVGRAIDAIAAEITRIAAEDPVYDANERIGHDGTALLGDAFRNILDRNIRFVSIDAKRIGLFEVAPSGVTMDRNGITLCLRPIGYDAIEPGSGDCRLDTDINFGGKEGSVCRPNRTIDSMAMTGITTYRTNVSSTIGARKTRFPTIDDPEESLRSTPRPRSRKTPQQADSGKKHSRNGRVVTEGAEEG